jgi:hypothetical protein
LPKAILRAPSPPAENFDFNAPVFAYRMPSIVSPLAAKREQILSSFIFAEELKRLADGRCSVAEIRAVAFLREHGIHNGLLRRLIPTEWPLFDL